MYRNRTPDSTGPALFTIGCSNGSLVELFAEIRRFGINALADVRSTPYSAYTPQFNRENLAEACRKEGVAYVYLGDEFGAMRTKPEPMSDGNVSAPVTDGIVDFTKVRQTEAFRRGVERVSRGLDKGLRIALMCTELEPERCHRAVMVSPAFADRCPIGHVTRGGEIMSHGDLEKRLLAQGGPYQDSLFGETALEQAYKNANLRIGAKIGKKESKHRDKNDYGRF